ncbi:MAG: hypothetical protein ACE5E7_13125 [Anaerolineae bacterium]
MATTSWVTVKKQWCEVLGAEAELMEKRVYPDDRLPDMEAYRVVAHKCTAAVTCNMIGCQCKWAYTNPATDRMA